MNTNTVNIFRALQLGIFLLFATLVHAQSSPDIYEINDATICYSYILPPIEGSGLNGSEAYYTAPLGQGIKYDPGDTLAESSFLFAFIETNGQTDQECFQVFILKNVELGPDTVIWACDQYRLPEIGDNSSFTSGYYSQSGRQGAFYSPGSVITTSTVLYAHTGAGVCASERKITIQLGPSSIFNVFEENAFCPYMLIDKDLSVYAADIDFEAEIDSFQGLTEPDSLWVLDEAGTYFGKSDTLITSGAYTFYSSFNGCITEKQYDIIVVQEPDFVPLDDVTVCSDSILLPESGLQYGYRNYHEGKYTNLGFRGGRIYRTFRNEPITFDVTEQLHSCRESSTFTVTFLETAESHSPLYHQLCSGYIHSLLTLRAHPDISFDIDEIVPVDDNPYVADNQFDTRDIPAGKYDFYLIALADPECTPLADTTLFTFEVVDDCALPDTTLERCTGFVVAQYYPEILGGSIYDLNGDLVSAKTTFNENIGEEDFQVNGAGYVYHLITNQFGHTDTARIYIDLIDSTLDVSLSASSLCYRECIEVEVNIDRELASTMLIRGLPSIPFAIFNLDSLPKNHFLTICYDINKSNDQSLSLFDLHKEDTIYLSQPNFVYDLEINVFASRCVSGMSNVSIGTMDLPVRDITSTICEDESLTILGNTYNANTPNGQIVIPGAAQEGCDSLINVSLTVESANKLFLNNTYDADDTVYVLCNPYYRGNETDTLYLSTPSARCDSIIYVNFRFESNQFYDTIQLCENDIIQFGALTIDQPGTYTQKFVTVSDNRDSIVSLLVVFEEQPITSQTISICNEFYVTELGDTLFSSGIYEDTFPSITSVCDSIIILDLLLFQEPEPDTLFVQLEEGEVFNHNGIRYDEAGIFSNIISLENGCDSVYVIIISTSSVPDRMDFYIPNIFSPNGDNVNDHFMIFIKEDSGVTIDEILIYNRWGNLVWDYDPGVNSSWDGRIDNSKAESGVYAIALKTSTFNGISEWHYGSVTLVR